MSSTSSVLSPGTLVVIDKRTINKLGLSSPLAIVDSHFRDGFTKVIMAKPVDKQTCNACGGEIRKNHRHGLATCKSCGKRFGATPTATIRTIPSDTMSEITFPEDAD